MKSVKSYKEAFIRVLFTTFFPLKNSPPNRMSSSFSGWAERDALNLKTCEKTPETIRHVHPPAVTDTLPPTYTVLCELVIRLFPV